MVRSHWQVQIPEVVEVSGYTSLHGHRPLRVPMLSSLTISAENGSCSDGFYFLIGNSGSWWQCQYNSLCLKGKLFHECFEELNNKFEVLACPPNSLDFNLIEHLWDVLDKHVRLKEAPPHSLWDLKDLLLTSWCQHTLRVLLESKPQQAALAAREVTDITT